MSLITSYFSSATPEQAAEQATRGFKEIRQFMQREDAQKFSGIVSQAEHIRQSAAARQRRRRLRIKESEVQLGIRDRESLRRIKPVKLRNPSPDPCPLSPADPAANSPAVPAKSRRPRTNWYEPSRWKLIDGAAKRIGFSSPTGIIRELKRGSSVALFRTIDRGTIGSWINQDRTGWTQEVLNRVARAANGETPRVVDPNKPLGRRPRPVGCLHT